MPNQAAAVTQAAQTLYGSDVTVYNATDSLFTSVFPNHELKLVISTDPGGIELNRLMAYRPLTETGYDMTMNFSALMLDGGIVLATSGQALDLGKLYATMANAETQMDRKIVYASNSTEVNWTVNDPAATSVVGGWRVTATTWAPLWGALTNWTIEFTTASITSGVGRIVAVQRGGFDVDFEQIYVGDGLNATNTYSPYATSFEWNGTPQIAPWDISTLPVTPIANVTTFDGSIIRVRYASAEAVPIDAYPEAELLAQSLAWAYNRTVQASIAPKVGTCAGVSGNQTGLAWKFFVRDVDCIILIDLVDKRAIGSPMGSGSTPDSLTFEATFAYRAALLRFGYYTDASGCDNTCMTRAIMTHELFHGIQKLYYPGIFARNGYWDVVTEATARMQETLTVNSYVQVANSTWYKDVEYSRSIRASLPTTLVDPLEREYVVDYAQRPFCNVRHYMAGYWGAVYSRAQGAGMSVITEVSRRIHENQTENPSADCQVTLPRVLDSVLNESSSNEKTFNTSLVDYAIRYYERNFSWGDPHQNNDTEDWSTHQGATRTTSALDDAAASVPSLGFHYFSLSVLTSYSVNCGSNTDWQYRVIKRSGGSWEPPTTLTCGVPQSITGTNWNEVILIAVRTGYTPETASVIIT